MFKPIGQMVRQTKRHVTFLKHQYSATDEFLADLAVTNSYGSVDIDFDRSNEEINFASFH